MLFQPPQTVKSARQILDGTDFTIQSILNQAQKLTSIQKVVNNYIDEDCSVASFENNELTLVTPKSTLATRILYRQVNLLSQLRRSGIDAHSLKVRVQPVFLHFSGSSQSPHSAGSPHSASSSHSSHSAGSPHSASSSHSPYSSQSAGTKTRMHRTLSADSAHLLNELAERTHDETLKKALQGIARHASD